MKCPVCKTSDLLMTERQGIEIDYCGTCRGVWLDRGELDKLSARPEPPHGEHRRDDWRRNGHSQSDYRDYGDGRGAYKKKKSVLGELFDFG
jgi:uncharacterized protein